MKNRATLFGILAVVIWSSSFPSIRATLDAGFPADHMLVYRFLVASAFFLVFALIQGRHFKLPRLRDIPALFLLGLFGITFYHGGVTFGQQSVSAGTTGIIVSSAPIFTTLIAILVFKEKLNRGAWLGLFVGFFGVSIIMLGGEGAGDGAKISIDMLYILFAAFATSVFFVYQRPFLKRYTALELTSYVTWFGTLPFLFISPGLLDTVQSVPTSTLLIATYLGIFPAAIGYILWAIAMNEGEVSLITSFLYFEPVLVIIIAYVWLGELPSLLAVIGGVIAISSVLIISYSNQRKRPPLVKKEDFSSTS